MSNKTKCAILRIQYQLYIAVLLLCVFTIYPSNLLAQRITDQIVINNQSTSVLDTIIKLFQVLSGIATLVLTTIMIIVNHDKVVKLLNPKKRENGKQNKEDDCA
jgi:hypothetical protein